MNAVPSPLQGGSGDEADPSMEEILASIRRIIADEHGAPVPQRQPPPSPVDMYRPKAAEARPEFPERMPRFEPPGARPVPGMPRAGAEPAVRADRLERAPDRQPPRPLPQSPPRPSPSRASFPSDRLISPEVDASVASAFDRLSRSLAGGGLPGSMDDTVRDMLRPMLKQWLDDNLPTLVERLVRAEIERVSRGR